MSMSKLGLEIENQRLYKMIEEKDHLERLDDVTSAYQQSLLSQCKCNPITGVNTNEND